MKLRNLFLASVACAGLFTACSSEMDEVVDNNGNGTNEEAFMQVGFIFPTNSAAGRAIDRDGDGKENGLPTEQSFSSIQLIITDASGTITDSKNLSAAAFTPEGTGFPGAGESGKTVYTSKSNIEVKKQNNALVYIFVNPTEAIKALTDKSGKLNKDLIHTEANASIGIATSGNFLMSNVGGAGVTASMNGTTNNPTKVSVAVDRVAAKLMENTAQTKWDIQQPASIESSKQLSIELTNFAYTNLNKTTYILEHNDGTYIKDTNFEFGVSKPSTSDFFYFNGADQVTESNFNFKAMAKGDITYCLENTAIAKEQYTDKTTGVIYKATAKWNGAVATTFYVYKYIVYFTFQELATAYNTDHTDKLDAVKDNTIAALSAKGIKMYENGVCYYRAMVKHQPSTTWLAPMEFAVVRNNVYKLNVQSIAGLGEPTIPTGPDPDEPDTSEAQLQLNVDVQPWTVRENNFDL